MKGNKGVNWRYFKIGVIFNVIADAMFVFVIFDIKEILSLNIIFSAVGVISLAIGVYYISKSNVAKIKL